MGLKILGQKAPAGSAATMLFESEGECVISSFVVCNRNAAADEFRMAIVPNGNALGNDYYLYYGTAISGNLTFTATLGLTLQQGDQVWVYSKNGYLTFSAFGQYNS